MKNFFSNYKTTFAALVNVLLVVLLHYEVFDQALFIQLQSIAIALGLWVSKDADKDVNPAQPSSQNKDQGSSGGLSYTWVLLLLSSFTLTFSSCTPKTYRLLEFTVDQGFDLAEEAGAFQGREFTIRQPFGNDTLVYYKGINEYLVLKTDSSYLVSFRPSRENLQDTTLYFIQKEFLRRQQKREDKKKPKP